MQHDTFYADDGEQLHVHLNGDGTPLLLLHGWTASHTAWAPLIEPLSQQHRLLRPDARGHGGHPLMATPTPDVKRLARDVVNLLDHYELERVVAVGHSMGALTLWQCLRDFGGDRFSHLVFIDQSPKLMTDATWQGGIYGDFDQARAQRLVEDLQADFTEAVLRLVAFGLNDKAQASYLRNSSGWRMVRESLKDIDPAPAIAIWQSLVAADYRNALPSINVPTLLAYGTASNFYTEATARFVADNIPQARLSFYEGADHGPHLAQPERFVSELTALIDRPQV
ncbi:alpha/beta fold hydrolase [Rhodoferax antarcticus]|uniref:alpha/beta fold hydrolase n=1 Tax=Rhodoferax antarcticus TaxID=81479 RepID=UPI00222454D2|nr:alpha/beta hydrolase [Rhodoferax antarcticus]MCW2311894.1 pimeloyl-ACP methyl ester carboxylesterase [Rhodoferax antarcticus]